MFYLRPTSAALIIALLLVTGSAYAHGAQAGERKEEQPPLVHPLQGPGTAEILKIWRQVVHADDVGKYTDMLVELDKLRQVQIDSGIRNLSSVSASLVFIAQRLVKNATGNRDIALSLARYAQLLSPDVPDYYFARSKLLWEMDKSAAGEYVSEYFQGLKLSLYHPPTLHTLLLGSIGIAWLMGILVMAVFSILILIRHLSLFSHDFGHFLPRGLSKFQRNVIGLILLSVPFLLDLGLVPLFAVWWVALWAYQTRSERIVTVVMVLFVYLWPIMNTFLVNSLSYTGSPADKAWQCQYEVCTWQDIYELELEAEGERGGEGSALLAIATAYLRASQTDTKALEKSYELYSHGIKGVSNDRNMDFGVGLGNVFVIKGLRRCQRANGNIDAGLDDFQNAIGYYDSVLSADATYWQAMVNKARVQAMLGHDSGEVTTLLAHAQTAAPRSAKDFLAQSNFEPEAGCPKHFETNRELAFPALSMPIIWTDRFDQEAFEEEVLALPIAHRLFIGPLETWMLALLATGVLVLVILLTAARRWLKPAGRCIKCNEIACVRCRPEFIGTGQCNQCVYYKIRSSYVDPKESWLREKRIENAISFRSKFQAFITFFVPGSGQILRGRTIRGVVFLFGLSTALGGVFLFTPIMSLGAAPQTHLATGSVISTAIWSLIAFVFYFLALIDIYSRR